MLRLFQFCFLSFLFVIVPIYLNFKKTQRLVYREERIIWRIYSYFVKLRDKYGKEKIVVREDIEKKLEKIAVEKSRLAQKEMLLRKKNEKKEIGRFIEVGRLAAQAGILTLNRETLLGAFLEISSRIADEQLLSSWKKAGEKTLFSNKQDLIISFAEVTSAEITNIMMSHSFRWNRFRKEWHGRGEKELLEKLLEGKNAKIEVITD